MTSRKETLKNRIEKLEEEMIKIQKILAMIINTADNNTAFTDKRLKELEKRSESRLILWSFFFIFLNRALVTSLLVEL